MDRNEEWMDLGDRREGREGKSLEMCDGYLESKTRT